MYTIKLSLRIKLDLEKGRSALASEGHLCVGLPPRPFFIANAFIDSFCNSVTL